IKSDMAQANAVGLAVAIVENGHLTYARGFGKKRVDAEGAVTPQTLFDVQSTTKSLTGAAAMALVDEGKLDLNAKVTHYVPYFAINPPFDPNTVTVRQVLTMTASYPTDPKNFDP